MKLVYIFPALVLMLALSTFGVAQRTDEVLATSTGATYKVTSLSPNAQKLYTERRRVLAETRGTLLADMTARVLLDLEAKAMNSTSDKLLETARAKAPKPNATEIQKIYDANVSALGGRPLAEVRDQIVDYLEHENEDKAAQTYLESLKARYKVVAGKDVNAVGLAPTEPLVTIGDRVITVKEFETTNRIRLNDSEIEIYEELRSDLEASIFSSLAAEEARSRNIDTGELIAVEITNKLTQFTDEERVTIESDLMRRLFTKYNVKIVMPEPVRIAQEISADDDPFTGNAAAPVTVVMFSDFQCSACARTHPILKQVVGEYKDQVRFVVRDFPLEKIHKDAFNAALAANAARAQGKFQPYTEILYRNQETLDKHSLLKYATELGLNVKQFELDFSDAKTAAEIRKDQADGRSYGVGGTPAIFVNGLKVHRLSINAFRAAIDRALKK